MSYQLKPHLQWRNFELRVQTAGHKGDSMTPHSHDFYELVFVHEGSARHCLGENSYPVRAGDVFIIPPGVTHVYRNANMGIYNMLFSKNFLKNFQQDMSGFPNYQLLFNISRELPLSHRLMSLDSAYFPEMTRLLDDIIQEQETGGHGSRSAVLSDFLRVVLLICRHSHPAGDPKNLHYAYRISNLMAVLNERYAESWNLEQMAAFAKMSVSGFRQQFRNLTGKAPVEYLLGIRLKKASEMLCLGEKTISEIALLCGFEDSNYFSRQFKNTHGMSPRSYRNMIERRNFEKNI